MVHLKKNTLEQITLRNDDGVEFSQTIPENNRCSMFSVSNNQFEPVLNSTIKSGIYRKTIIPKNVPEVECNKNITYKKDLEEQLKFLASDVLALSSADNFKLYKNALVRKDFNQRKRFIYKILEPKNLNLYSPSTIMKNCSIKRNVGRPRNSSIKESEPEKQIIPVSITRSGRISKPNIKEDNFINLTNYEPTKEFDNINLNEIKDKDFKYYKEITNVEKIQENENCKIKRIRKLPEDSQCPVCKKILLGKRMKKHFEAFPDHNTKSFVKAQSSVYEHSLYKFLVNKIQQLPNDDNLTKIELFLTELSDLIEQIQSRNTKLVQNASGEHFVSSKLSKVLGISEGQYSFNINALNFGPDSSDSLDEHVIARPLAPPPPRLADYNLSISLDDTLTAKLNLTDNVIPSEESLLRTVDDLVPQDIKRIDNHDEIILSTDMLQLSQNNSKDMIMHYEASDNAVEATNIKGSTQQQIIDLSMDLFQFRTT